MNFDFSTKSYKLHKLRKLTTKNPHGDNWGITVPKEIVASFMTGVDKNGHPYTFDNPQTVYFKIYASGNAIIMESGAKT